MGRDLALLSPAAGAVFRAADEALGEPISELAFGGPPEQLDLTVNAQPAILATSIAYLRAIEDAGAIDALRPSFYAGHSMGQYSALVAAGVLPLAEALRLVRERGRQMQASAPTGAMAAIIGLPDDLLPQLVAAGQSAGVFTVANRNSPGQVVVSGDVEAVRLAADTAKELGARRAVILPVSVAAHSPLMARAADAMRALLVDVNFADPAAPLLANADARPLTTGDECRDELVEHLTKGVDWVAEVERMVGAGVTRFVEIGPGRVLSGLIKRIAPEAENFALDDPAAPGRLYLPTPSPVTGATA